jgi:DNA-binding response OmpR family regulator
MAKILVVDDEPDYLDSIALLLKLDGHEVASAEDGADAIEGAGRFGPDVALIDWMLKGDLDGLGVVRALRRINNKAGMIVMTGYSIRDLDHEVKDISDLYVLQKPFDGDGLRIAIRQAMAGADAESPAGP